MALEKIEIENFTAFDHLELTFSPGLNVLIGENGTGKTHLMKLGYSGIFTASSLDLLQRKFPLDTHEEEESRTISPTFIHDKKIIDIFLPFTHDVNRLIKQKNKETYINTYIKDIVLHTAKPRNSFHHSYNLPKNPHPNSIKAIYIPPKDALANAPGFRSLYEKREIHFESIYKDILDSAFLPFLRESNLTKAQQNMLAMLEKHMGGKVLVRGETFFLDNGNDEPLEFDLLAEGLRKLGLLWLLIRNGELDEGTVLFWDEPESNLNPKLMGVIVQVLIELQRMKVQVILATHNFVLLHEMHLRLEKQDKILFHSLYKDPETQEIKTSSTADYHQITHNPISEVYSALLERELAQSFEEDVSKDAAE